MLNYTNSITFVPMQLTNEMIENLANLSRLTIQEDEKESIKNDMEKMVSFIEQLQEVDTTGVAPLMHMGDAVNVLRADELKGSISLKDALLNAPDTDGQYFKVPKVISK